MSSIALMGSGGSGGGGDASAANQLLEIAELQDIGTTVALIQTQVAGLAQDITGPNGTTLDVLLQSQSYALQLDESASPITYIGQALPGSSTSSAAWSIKKMDETSGLVITWADGSSEFNQVWDDRASLTYL